MDESYCCMISLSITYDIIYETNVNIKQQLLCREN